MSEAAGVYGTATLPPFIAARVDKLIMRLGKYLSLNQLEQIERLLDETVSKSGHGELVIRFQNGHVRIVQVCQNIEIVKPERSDEG